MFRVVFKENGERTNGNGAWQEVQYQLRQSGFLPGQHINPDLGEHLVDPLRRCGLGAESSAVTFEYQFNWTDDVLGELERELREALGKGFERVESWEALRIPDQTEEGLRAAGGIREANQCAQSRFGWRPWRPEPIPRPVRLQPQSV